MDSTRDRNPDGPAAEQTEDEAATESEDERSVAEAQSNAEAQGQSEPAKKYGIAPEEYELDGDDDEPVPRLPRGGGFHLSTPELIRIVMFAALLVAVIVLRKPCSEGVARFMETFAVDAGPAPSGPAIPERTIRLTGEETEAELQRKIDGLLDAGPGDALK